MEHHSKPEYTTHSQFNYYTQPNNYSSSLTNNTNPSRTAPSDFYISKPPQFHPSYTTLSTDKDKQKELQRQKQQEYQLYLQHQIEDKKRRKKEEELFRLKEDLKYEQKYNNQLQQEKQKHLHNIQTTNNNIYNHSPYNIDMHFNRNAYTHTHNQHIHHHSTYNNTTQNGFNPQLMQTQQHVNNNSCPPIVERMLEFFFKEQVKIIKEYKQTIEQLKTERDQALYINKANEEKIQALQRLQVIEDKYSFIPIDKQYKQNIEQKLNGMIERDNNTFSCLKDCNYKSKYEDSNCYNKEDKGLDIDSLKESLDASTKFVKQTGQKKLLETFVKEDDGNTHLYTQNTNANVNININDISEIPQKDNKSDDEEFDNYTNNNNNHSVNELNIQIKETNDNNCNAVTIENHNEYIKKEGFQIENNDVLTKEEYNTKQVDYNDDDLCVINNQTTNNGNHDYVTSSSSNDSNNSSKLCVNDNNNKEHNDISIGLINPDVQGTDTKTQDNIITENDLQMKQCSHVSINQSIKCDNNNNDILLIKRESEQNSSFKSNPFALASSLNRNINDSQNIYQEKEQSQIIISNKEDLNNVSQYQSESNIKKDLNNEGDNSLMVDSSKLITSNVKFTRYPRGVTSKNINNLNSIYEKFKKKKEHKRTSQENNENPLHTFPTHTETNTSLYNNNSQTTSFNNNNNSNSNVSSNYKENEQILERANKYTKVALNELNQSQLSIFKKISE